MKKSRPILVIAVISLLSNSSIQGMLRMASQSAVRIPAGLSLRSFSTSHLDNFTLNPEKHNWFKNIDKGYLSALDERRGQLELLNKQADTLQQIIKGHRRKIKALDKQIPYQESQAGILQKARMSLIALLKQAEFDLDKTKQEMQGPQRQYALLQGIIQHLRL